MKKILSFVLFVLFSVSVYSQDAKLFKYKFNKDDKSRILSTVNENVYLNGALNHTSVILNRISSEITNVSEDGSGTASAVFMTTESAVTGNNVLGANYTWGEEYKSIFERSPEGKYTIDDIYFMPTVRDVPVFPDYPVQPGDTWQAEGSEVHDCKELFGMKNSINVPFVATYKYERDEEIDGIKLNVISVYYEFSQTSDGKEYYSTYYGTEGWAKQTIYWDASKGDLDHYTEDFVIAMYDIAGNQYVFKGASHGEVTEYKSVNDDTNVEKLQEVIEKNNLDNVSVTRGEKGLTISLENIQFEADSNILLPSEQEKLKKIGSILKEFSNDLLITGHCAERGTVSARQKLSEERAQTVAQFLITSGIRDEYHIFTQGKGSTQPIASNDTEEGRARNRRVEITIMD